MTWYIQLYYLVHLQNFKVLRAYFLKAKLPKYPILRELQTAALCAVIAHVS